SFNSGAVGAPAPVPISSGHRIAEFGRRGAMLRAPAETAMAGEVRLGPLPEWDLGDLYPGRDSPELARDLADLAAQASAFRARYEDHLAGLSGGELAAAVAEYEKLQEVAGRIISYAELTRAGNVVD